MKIIDLKTTKPEVVIDSAINVLRNRGMLVYPTETCYGIGVDATDPKAVEKLLRYKGKRGGNPIAIAVANREMAQRFVKINETANNLYAHFLPGPLTVVSRSLGKVAPTLEGGKGTLGVRIPNYKLTLRLIKEFGKPITTTSANTSGKKPPYSLTNLHRYTTRKRLQLIDLFLDAGSLPPRLPSTVIDTTLNEPLVLRQGEITIPETTHNTWISNSEAKTRDIAAKVMERCLKTHSEKPLIIALQGELGAGKTQFVKGIAEALGIGSNIPSPTFILIREYPFTGKNKKAMFYHIDTWRMERGDELQALGLQQMLKPGNVIAVEWLQKVKGLLLKLQTTVLIVWVDIKILSDTKRRIVLKFGRNKK